MLLHWLEKFREKFVSQIIDDSSPTIGKEEKVSTHQLKRS